MPIPTTTGLLLIYGMAIMSPAAATRKKRVIWEIVMDWTLLKHRGSVTDFFNTALF
jgi:hypothetical protein